MNIGFPPPRECANTHKSIIPPQMDRVLSCLPGIQAVLTNSFATAPPLVNIFTSFCID